MWTQGYFGPAKKIDLLLFWRECRGRESFLPNLLFSGLVSHLMGIYCDILLNVEQWKVKGLWTSKWKLLKNWAKSFFFPQRRTLKYTLGKKKLLKIGRKTIKCLVMLNFAAHFLCTVHCLCLPLGMCCQIFVKMTSNGNGWCVSWRQCNKFRRSWLQRTFRSRRGKQRKQPLVNAKRCCSFSYVRYTIQTINHQNKCCWLILLICCFKVYLLSVSSWYS